MKLTRSQLPRLPQQPWIGLLCLLALGTVAVPTLRGQATGSGAEDAAAPVPVETLTVTPVEEYQVERTYTGAISALRASDLGFERSGQLTAMLVGEGDRVQAGAPLARLDIRNLQTQRQQLLAEKARATAQLQELLAGARQEDIAAAAAAVRDLEQQLSLQQTQLARRENLYAQGAISREELDEFSFSAAALNARLDEARSRLQELQNGTRPEQVSAQQALVQQLSARIAEVDVNLAKSTLTAPFTGRIAAKAADEGTVVGAGQTVMRLLEDAVPEVRVGVPTQLATQLQPGQPRQVTLGSQTYPAIVTSVVPEVDSVTRTQTVILTLSQSVGQASAGQTARVAFTESVPTDGIWLPATALTQGIRGLWNAYVVVPQEETFVVEPQAVEILHQENDRVLVRGTLQPGDRVVASGTHRLVPQQPVEPLE